MADKKILVIGGSGFLGSHVCDALTEAGYSVRILDRMASPYVNDKQQMIVGDMLDLSVLENAIAGCSVVYNFAGIADLDEALNKPVETVRVNILGNVQILDMCRKHKVSRYIYASTVYVHSRDGGFYRCSKQACEHYIEEYEASYGLEYTILRYGSLYGTRSNQTNGLWRIVKQALETGSIRYEGNGESIREYIHVEDAARTSVLALGNEFKNQHVVLTGQEPMRVLDLLKMLSEILNIQEEVVFENRHYAGHYIRTPYAYKEKLGRKYIPAMHIDLGQGLVQLIKYIKSSQQ